MKARQDLAFLITPKRPEKSHVSLPEDWGIGYGKVVIVFRCESQYTEDRRLPVFLKLPVRYKRIVRAQVVQEINIDKYLGRYLQVLGRPPAEGRPRRI